MPRVSIADLTTPGRRTEVVWRRDENEPGYVQLATHPVDGEGEYVHLDSARIDLLIHELQQAQQGAYVEAPRQPVVEPYGEQVGN